MKAIRHIIFIILSLSFHCIHAEVRDSLYSGSPYLPAVSFFDAVYTNPAARFTKPEVSHENFVEGKYTYSNREQFHLLQEGKSLSEYMLHASGTVRKDKNMFWGKGGYKNSTTRDVQWSDISDYNRISPYIIADSIGGDTFGEKYFLSGGMSVITGKWSFGFEAGYEAGNSYRKTDPRPLTTVSDIFLKLGISREAGKNYLAGLTLSGGLYRQDLNMKVVESNKRYDFYAMKGFGMYNHGIKINESSYNWLYDGKNAGFSIFILPMKSGGLLLNSTCQYEKIKSFQSTVNHSTSSSVVWNNLAGWQFLSAGSSLLLKINYNYSSRNGTEYIYETIKINEVFEDYLLISEGTFYTHKTNNTRITGLYEWYSARNNTWLEAGAGIRNSNEKYVYPEYQINLKHLLVSLEAGNEFLPGKLNSFTAKVRGSYIPLLSETIKIPEEDPFFRRAVMPDMNIRRANMSVLQAGLTYQHGLNNKISIYVAGDFSAIFANGNSRTSGSISVGTRF